MTQEKRSFERTHVLQINQQCSDDGSEVKHKLSVNFKLCADPID